MSHEEDFLNIDSPRTPGEGGYVFDGQFVVVYEGQEGENGEWAIVALDWCKSASGPSTPSLGLRWGYQQMGGIPRARGHSAWLILPKKVSYTILNGIEELVEESKPIQQGDIFKLPKAKINLLKEFLDGGKGEDLKRKWNEKQA